MRQDVATLVVDDGAGSLVPQHRHGGAIAVVRIGAGVDLLQVTRAVQPDFVGATIAAEGSALGPEPKIDDGAPDRLSQPLEPPGLGSPSAVVTLTGQFLGGPVVLRANDSAAPAQLIIVEEVACGAFFCLAGMFGGSIFTALTLLSGEVIALLAGLALNGSIGCEPSELLANP